MGDDPTLMLNAPVPSARKILERAGMTIDDIDLFEINEAFAVVSEKFMRDLDLDRDKVNVNGGAMALGHPIGATGAILIGTALDERTHRVGVVARSRGVDRRAGELGIGGEHPARCGPPLGIVGAVIEASEPQELVRGIARSVEAVRRARQISDEVEVVLQPRPAGEAVTASDRELRGAQCERLG
jgi:hypothetical protein